MEMSRLITRPKLYVALGLVFVFGMAFWHGPTIPATQSVMFVRRLDNRINKTQILVDKLVKAEQTIFELKSNLIDCQNPKTSEDDRITNLKNILQRHNLLWTQENTIPPERDLGREMNFPSAQQYMINHVTVVLFSFQETSACLKQRIDRIVHEYPKIKLLVLTSSSAGQAIRPNTTIECITGIEKQGKALEMLTSKVTSKYFLYLSNGVEISPQKSEESASWLLHALQRIPELDFVGGSFLRYEERNKSPVLEIPCHRLRLCNWTLSQSFEYRYSVNDMMICEETSSSFMGRTESLKKVEAFDPKLDTMATTDFFLRAKGKAIVGLRPEVWFPVSSACTSAKLSSAVEADLKLEFMRKHQLYRITDSFGHEVRVIDSSSYETLRNYGIVHWVEHMYGDPFFNQGLLQTLELSADFLESKNISYFVDAGVALGAIKMRGILPWDQDVDIGFYAKGSDVKRGLAQYCKTKGVRNCTMRSVQTENGLMEIWLYGQGEAYTTLFEQPGTVSANAHIYMYINGRRYPVRSYLFTSTRYYYGNRYLEMHVDPSAKMLCGKPGHHACVPEEFAKRGGHWRDLYCQL